MVETITQPGYTFNLAFTGAKNTGKSCLISRFVSNVYEDDELPTIGTCVYYKCLPINKLNTKLIIYDLAGQERLKAFRNSIEQRSDCVLLCYDITSYSSYQFAKVRYRQLKQRLRDTVEFFMIGTKSDLFQRRQVSEEQASEFAHSNAMLFFQLSAKVGTQIEIIFKIITGKLIGNFMRKNLIFNLEQCRKKEIDWKKIKMLVPLLTFVFVVVLSAVY